ncbi:formylglycine-generating enzyme family protein [Flaviaesturariibacter amylovorans]|uniref:Sulfatase-modifying factor enzyme-like domain-containing protein n=1 Tax=Flaviaesturariibacter amylovorans TaxID=1084520 RepID=A0ABP8HVU7_9BACT
MLRIVVLAALCTGLWAFAGGRKKTAPPGTVRVNDSLFMDRTEVAIVHWREYTFWKMRLEGTADGSLPDSCWMPNEGYSGPGTSSDCTLGQLYFRHPAFNFYPVVAVSYEQAEAFCRWRTERVNELIAREPHRWAFRQVRYRLPTEAEWEAAGQGGLDPAAFPFGVRDTVSRKGHALLNYGGRSHWGTYETGRPPEVATWPADAGGKNGFGLYGMTGNVAEMTARPGIAKGGHYGLPADSCRITARQRYEGPQPWLGFRCVATVER